jgi:hypothetical protein
MGSSAPVATRLLARAQHRDSKPSPAGQTVSRTKNSSLSRDRRDVFGIDVGCGQVSADLCYDERCDVVLRSRRYLSRGTRPYAGRGPT